MCLLLISSLVKKLNVTMILFEAINTQYLRKDSGYTYFLLCSGGIFISFCILQIGQTCNKSYVFSHNSYACTSLTFCFIIIGFWIPLTWYT